MKREEKRKMLIEKIAKDSNINRIAELFLSQYALELSGVEEGQRISPNVPVGKDKFLDWMKKVIEQFFPSLLGILENERTLKDYATQVADAIAKSDTRVENPLKDYKVSTDPVYIKAFCTAQLSPAKPKVENPFPKMTEIFRYDTNNVLTHRSDPENPQSAQFEKFPSNSADNSEGYWNKSRPIKPFFEGMNDPEIKKVPKKVDKEKPYDVFKDNQELAETKNKKESKLSRLSKKAQMLYGPTSMSSRYCPDHPGIQLQRIEDGVGRCDLDGKIYDFSRGFTTEDGTKHNGGSVQNQNFLPPGTSIVKKKAQLADSQKTHGFLYQVLSYLPAESRERKILNYKFQNNISLEEAIQRIEESERLAAEQKVMEQK